MDGKNEQESWLDRVEALINILEGSTISELELSEGGTEIIIRRQPQVRISAPIQHVAQGQAGIPVVPGTPGRAAKEDRSIAIAAPLTGVYYAAPSPTLPPFVSIGDVVQAGQIVALVEAMKVFNEIQSEVAGRVTALVATSGNLVQKGDVLIRIEPL